jgi:hypothetical protein
MQNVLVLTGELGATAVGVMAVLLLIAWPVRALMSPEDDHLDGRRRAERAPRAPVSPGR